MNGRLKLKFEVPARAEKDVVGYSWKGWHRGPKLEVLIPAKLNVIGLKVLTYEEDKEGGLPFIDAFRIAVECGRTIASGARISEELRLFDIYLKDRSEFYNAIKKVFAEYANLSEGFHLAGGKYDAILAALSCHSGTLTAYTEPDKALGAAIKYTDPRTSETWVFPVPKEYQNEKNAILVVEHPNYQLDVRTDRKSIEVFANESDICLIGNFPAGEQGWFPEDAKHGIPVRVTTDSPQIRESNKLTYLLRIAQRVGPLILDHMAYDRTSQNCPVVDLALPPSTPCGLIVESD